MFKLNQKVYCALFGAGVVEKIHTENITYPVVVRFNDGLSACYTADGNYHHASGVTLFPYPVEIVKADTKPSIDWSHVSENFQYLAMDADGEFYLYPDKPQQGELQWVSRQRLAAATHFASFVPGTCDWKDSLVKRPD